MVGVTDEDREPGAIVLENEPFDVVRANSSLDESFGRSPSSKSRTGSTSRQRSRQQQRNPTLRVNVNPTKPTSTSTKSKTKPADDVGDLPALSRKGRSESNESTVDVNAASSSMSQRQSKKEKAMAIAKAGFSVSESANSPGLPEATALTRNVTGGRSARTRPMSPPSRAGVDDPEIYQRSTNRKPRHSRDRKGNDNDHDDEDSDDDFLGEDESEIEGTNDGSGTQESTVTPSASTATGTFSRGRSYRSEMPMDERREYEDEMQALGLCDVNGEGSQGMPEFCETAMTAVNELCAGGIGAVGSSSPSRRIDTDIDIDTGASASNRRALKLGEKHINPKGVEEQTAIEVEYVEPLYRGKNGDESGYSSPKRKNALLKAMTIRAKKDYHKSGKKDKRVAAEAAIASPPSEDNGEDDSNVYSTFSNSEKRKFLQLINGGNTPFEATSRVLKERLEGNGNDGVSVADSSFQSDIDDLNRSVNTSGYSTNTKSPARSGSKKPRMKFWKRGGKTPTKENSTLAKSDPANATATAKSNASPQPRSQPSSPRRLLPAGSNEDEGVPKDDVRNEIYEDDASDGSGSSCERVGDEIKKFLKDERSREKGIPVEVDANANADIRQASSPRSKSNSQPASPRSPPAPAPVIDEDEDSRFEKSGISYYDAVRKDRSEDGDEAYYYNDGEYPAESESKKHRKLKIPKGIKGSFSKLRERNRGTPVPEDDEIQDRASAVDPPEDDDSNDQEIERMAAAAAAVSQPQPTPERHPLLESHLSIPSPTKDHLRIIGVVSELDSEVDPQEGEDNAIVAQASYDEEKKNEEDSRLLEDALEDAMTAQLLSVDNQMPDIEDEIEDKKQMEEPVPSPAEIVDDLNMDAYLGATETMTHLPSFTGNSNSFDASASVVSGKSYKTHGTNFTTQSTRSRRPGQAKARLERERRSNVLNTSVASTKTRGWQESIEAAAARSGKVWDPDHGWKDYIDPKKLEVRTDDFYIESAEASNHVQVQQVQVQQVEAAQFDATPSDVAQLAEWRDSARSPRSPARSTAKSPRQRTAKSPGRTAKSPGRTQQSPGRQRRTPQKPVTPKEERPRGWAATMKAATAKLNMQGKKWDPEKGWLGLTDQEAKDVSEAIYRQSNDVAITAESDTQDFGTLSAVQQLDEIANKQDKSLQFLSEDEDTDANGNHNHSGDDHTNDGSSAGKSKASGRYIQIADSGSVREYQRNNRNREVNVRKQNLNQDDADFFPEGGPKRGPVDLDDVYEQEQGYSSLPNSQEKLKIISGPNANAVYQKIYESQSNEDFDDAAATDFSWDADEANQDMNNLLESQNGKPAVPRLKIKIRDAGSVSQSVRSKAQQSTSEASFESNTSIPKLAAPKRDTSPIRGSSGGGGGKTRRGAAAVPPPSEPFEESAPVLISPSKDEDDSIDAIFEEAAQLVVEDTIQIIVGDVHEAEVAHVVDRITPTASRNPKSSKPAKVSALHKMWENKTKSWDKEHPPAEDIAAKEENTNYKQYLGKKVRAESAAAIPKPPSPSPRKNDRDTVFDFDGRDTESDAPKNFEDVSNISPIRHDESDSEAFSEVVSEASTALLQGTTFLQRLQACAAPIVLKGGQFAKNQAQSCNESNHPISAHLAFMRQNPNVGSNSPDKKGGIMEAAASAAMCGRPGIIVEDEETVDEEESNATPTTSREQAVSPPRERKQRPRSNPRPRQQNKDDLSSVVSDGFGAQSAYLEAIAMRAAVSSGSKKKKKKRSQGSEASASTTSYSQARQSPGSEVSDGTGAGNSKHSGKFQEFLDRRASKEAAAATPSPTNNQLPDHRPPTGRSEVSSRAEKYASEKMNEMMDSMAGRAKEDYEETGAFPTLPGAGATQTTPVNDAARIAAEELAAARVEAMMQRLSSQNLEDHEAEI